MPIEKLVTSKEVSQKLNKLGVKQESLYAFYRRGGYFAGNEKVEPLEPNIEKNVGTNVDFPYEFIAAAFTIPELGELLKPYMKDIEISARDDIFNPDFWGNYLISRLSNE